MLPSSDMGDFMKNLFFALLFILNLATLAKDPPEDDRILPLILENNQITEIIESTERIHNTKCQIQNALKHARDIQIKYGCLGEATNKVLIKATMEQQKLKILNYQVFIK